MLSIAVPIGKFLSSIFASSLSKSLPSKRRFKR